MAPVLRKALADPLAELEFRLSEPGLRKTDPSFPAVEMPAPREDAERLASTASAAAIASSCRGCWQRTC